MKNHKKKPAKKPPEENSVSILQKLKLQGKARSRMSLQEDSEDVSSIKQAISKLGLPDKSSREGSKTTQNEAMELNSEDIPDWYEDLSDDALLGFKELFDTLDAAKTGILNADSLYEGLKKIDSDITREEVENVLKKLDKDGNGEIDFDEFLYHMTQGDLSESVEDTGKKRGLLSKRQRMFYTALNTIKQIERSYFARMPQSPHVLSHYTAGVRLIGLTDRQLAKQMKKMQKASKQHNSPYAKPLPFVSQSGSVKRTRRRIQGDSRHYSKYQLATERTQIGASPKSSEGKGSKFKLTDCSPFAGHEILEEEKTKQPPDLFDDTALGANAFKESVRLFSSNRGNLFSKFQHIMSTQFKEKRMSIANMMPSFVPPEIILPSDRPSLTFKVSYASEPEQPTNKVTTAKSGAGGGCGWKSKVVDFDKVPLPVLKIKYKKSRPTIDDLPDIREKATQAIDDYYRNLRRATVNNSFEHWERLYADTIRSKKLLENFRTVYRAYSPHKEEEAFVVAPWSPGPYRHFRRAGGLNNGSIPGTRQDGRISSSNSPDFALIKRPFTAV